jgi:hypothetical protein
VKRTGLAGSESRLRNEEFKSVHAFSKVSNGCGERKPNVLFRAVLAKIIAGCQCDVSFLKRVFAELYCAHARILDA